MIGTTLEVRRALGDRAVAWDALVDGMPAPSPFLRSWWLDAVHGPGAEFLLVTDGDDLVGGVPLELDRKRGVGRWRLIGSGALAPHNLDLVAASGREDDVAAALRAHLGSRGIVDLFGVDPGSALARFAPDSARTDPIGAAPWIAVRKSIDDYIASRPRKLRQELRRVQRRLTDAGAEYRVAGDTGWEDALARFAELHGRRWRDESVLLPAFAELIAALRAGSDRGEVVFHEVAAGERVLASLVSFDVAGSTSWYQMGRDPDPRWANSGTFLKVKAVERSCRLGHRRIDLCIGTPRVKVEWADGQQAVVRIRWARGPLARAVLAALVVARPVRADQ